MPAAPQWNFVSIDDYLAGEEESPVKHEYVDGVAYAMAGATNAHNIIAVGVTDTDMLAAVRHVIDMQGGLVVVEVDQAAKAGEAVLVGARRVGEVVGRETGVGQDVGTPVGLHQIAWDADDPFTPADVEEAEV